MENSGCGENFKLLTDAVRWEKEKKLTLIHEEIDIIVDDKDFNKAIDILVDGRSQCENMLKKAKIKYNGLHMSTSRSNSIEAETTNNSLDLTRLTEEEAIAKVKEHYKEKHIWLEAMANEYAEKNYDDSLGWYKDFDDFEEADTRPGLEKAVKYGAWCAMQKVLTILNDSDSISKSDLYENAKKYGLLNYQEN